MNPRINSRVMYRLARRGITQEQVYSALMRENGREPGIDGLTVILGNASTGGGRLRRLRVYIRESTNSVLNAAWEK